MIKTTEFICPYNEWLSIDKFIEPKTGQITKVIIRKNFFYKKEHDCAIVAFGSGCKYYDREKHRCVLEWDEDKLNQHIKELVEKFYEEGVPEVEVIE